jgi:hypothetical protein
MHDLTKNRGGHGAYTLMKLILSNSEAALLIQLWFPVVFLAYQFISSI